MDTSLLRRLPGIRFEAQPPITADSMPRMDVAIFVGFASAGPLHVPVLVDDAGQFHDLFGDDAPLAWDGERGEQVCAYLGPAVRAFFRNGGQRCWVVRVADEVSARYNYFPVPGLAQAQFDDQGNCTKIFPAFARARSQGSWSDRFAVSACVHIRSVDVDAIWRDDGGIVVDLVEHGTHYPNKGDLLRITFRDISSASFSEEACVLMLAVSSASSAAPVSPQSRSLQRIKGELALWFKTRAPFVSSPPEASLPARAWVFVRESDRPLPVADDERQTADPCWESRRFASDAVPASVRLSSSADPAAVVELDLPPAAAPSPGSLVHVEVGGEHLWLTVRDVGISLSNDPPAGDTVRFQLRGHELWPLTAAPWWLPVPGIPVPKSTAIECIGEVVSFDLHVRQGDAVLAEKLDLGLVPGHPRFWGMLHTDDVLYRESGIVAERKRVELSFENERTALWRTELGTRFPMAGCNDQGGFYFPTGMSFLPEQYLSRVIRQGTPLERDGLAAFDVRLFLDHQMTGSETATVMEHADFLRYLSPSPRPLRGIHAALGFGSSSVSEEVTIIAVPDAIHRGWFLTPDRRPLPEIEFAPLPRPAWWHFFDCTSNEAVRIAREPERENFLECGIRVIPAPVLTASGTELNPDDTCILSWTTCCPGATYILEESARTDFMDSVRIYRGEKKQFTVYGSNAGVYYYRVRAETDRETSDWSKGVPVRRSPQPPWTAVPVREYDPETLLAVQRSLFRMCAGRGDLFAVLSLPEQYREAEAIDHVAALKTPPLPGSYQDAAAVSPLGSGEENDLTFGALYHPWLLEGATNATKGYRPTPPEGAVCGMLARRSRERGAWIAPANEPFQGVTALTPPIKPERRLDLQEAQINIVRQEPRGFMTLSADTLGNDPDLRPINVRRLMMLLRRAALRLGTAYVFEPNGDELGSQVERGFEALLSDLFFRGAFKGATPDEAFRVVTGGSLNTRQSRDVGRFLVELRVAPSLPMTFLTVRLEQTGDRMAAVEGR